MLLPSMPAEEWSLCFVDEVAFIVEPSGARA